MLQRTPTLSKQRVMFSHVAFFFVLQLAVACAGSTSLRSRLVGPGHDRRLVSRSTTYCYDLAYYLSEGISPPPAVGNGLPGCEAQLPTAAPECSLGDVNPSSGVCRCPGGTLSCDLHSASYSASYEIAYCTRKTVYVQGGGEAQTMTEFCHEHVLLDAWENRVRPSGSPERTWSAWYYPCWAQWGFTWQDGACRSTTRHLGETCWDGGECHNDGIASYDGYRLSCSSFGSSDGGARCVPSVLPIERNQCSCAWFDWWLFVACGSNDCNGHACVLSTGDGNSYCDYQTDGNWR